MIYLFIVNVLPLTTHRMHACILYIYNFFWFVLVGGGAQIEKIIVKRTHNTINLAEIAQLEWKLKNLTAGMLVRLMNRSQHDVDIGEVNSSL